MGRVYAMIAMHVDHARGARRTNIDLETKIDNHDYMTNDMKLDYCHPIYIEKWFTSPHPMRMSQQYEKLGPLSGL